MAPLEISAVDPAIDRIFCYFINLIMLIYARNQTFCSKSVNKALKMLIFGIDTLCSTLGNCTWKKNPVSKLISYAFYCFMNFLCISLFFRPFVFVIFLAKFVAAPFWSTIISIIWTKWKNSICIDFVHNITFWAFFGPTCMYKKLRNFGTVCGELERKLS